MTTQRKNAIQEKQLEEMKDKMESQITKAFLVALTLAFLYNAFA